MIDPVDRPSVVVPMRLAYLAVALVSLAAAGTADATPKTASKSAPKVTATATAKTAKADKATKPAATSSKKKRRRTAVFSGANASKSQIRTEPLERPSGEIWLKAENLGEEFKGYLFRCVAGSS